MPQRLERSRSEKMVAGVCGGIAEYLQVDVTWVRLTFALLTFFGGVGLLAYIVLILIMPLPAEGAAPAVAAGEGAAAVADPARTTRLPADPADMERRRQFAGYALIAVGVIFLLGNQGAFRFIEWRFAWPLALVAVGVLLLVQRSRR